MILRHGRHVALDRSWLGSVQVKLTTTGRRSGLPRDVTLYAWPDTDAERGERWILVGSWGGGDRDPSWAANLRAEPRATLGRGRNARPVVAKEITGGTERDRLWTLVCEAFPLYATYQRRTSRRIPLFVLETTTPAEPAAVRRATTRS